MSVPGPDDARARAEKQAEQELVERLRALSEEQADEAFRERLRTQFVEGRLDEGIRSESASRGEEPLRSPPMTLPSPGAADPRADAGANPERPVHRPTPDDRTGRDATPEGEPRASESGPAFVEHDQDDQGGQDGLTADGSDEDRSDADRSDEDRSDADGLAEYRPLVRALAASARCEAPHGAPAADERFRAELRRCFLTGEFALGAEPPQSRGAPSERRSAPPDPALPGLPPGTARPLAKRSPAAQTARAARREREAASRRARLRLLRGVVVAAAAAALAFVLMRPSDPLDDPGSVPSWDLRLLEGDGLVALGDSDERVPFARLAADPRAFLRAGPIRTHDSRLQLVLAGALSVELTPASVVDPGGLIVEADGDPWSLRVERGEAFVRKHPESRERPLSVHTLDAEVLVLGTSLGVYCDERITCVCVAEGEVEVRPDEGGQPMPVGEETTLILVRDAPGRPLAGKPFPQTDCPGDTPHEHHVCPLREFTERTRGTL